MTAQYIVDTPSEKHTSHAVQLQTKVQGLETRATYIGLLASFPHPKYIFPANRLPHNSTYISNMYDDNPDKAGFHNAQNAEFNSIVAMGTWQPHEVIPVANLVVAKLYILRNIILIVHLIKLT